MYAKVLIGLGYIYRNYDSQVDLKEEAFTDVGYSGENVLHMGKNSGTTTRSIYRRGVGYVTVALTEDKRHRDTTDQSRNSIHSAPYVIEVGKVSNGTSGDLCDERLLVGGLEDDGLAKICGS